jgi:hypothetical protein
MLGFSDKANLDEGTMWPIYFALTELTADDEARISALVKKAGAEDPASRWIRPPGPSSVTARPSLPNAA